MQDNHTLSRRTVIAGLPLLVAGCDNSGRLFDALSGGEYNGWWMNRYRLGGHSIAVFQPHSARAKSQSKALLKDGRVNFFAPADYCDGKPIDAIVKAIMDKVAANKYVERFQP